MRTSATDVQIGHVSPQPNSFLVMGPQFSQRVPWTCTRAMSVLLPSSLNRGTGWLVIVSSRVLSMLPVMGLHSFQLFGE